MIRTVALLILFTWFANAGARLGAETLAANHVLLQFVSFAAFILDAFAFTAEERVGSAFGQGDREPHFLRAVRLTGEFSLASGAVLALAFLLLGGPLIDFLTTDAGVRETARALPSLRRAGSADRHAQLACSTASSSAPRAGRALAQCRRGGDGALYRSRPVPCARWTTPASGSP